ncbi:hypothetical protein [Lichenicola sp.]|uniref:hypothetical protein n=1 Tax=Lichenicola sp. TaxID=2804529 RepID=UPI003AFFFC6D
MQTRQSLTEPARLPAQPRSWRRARARPHLLAAAIILVVLGALWTRTRVEPLSSYDQGFYLGIAYDLVHHGRFTDGYRFAGGDADTIRPPGMRFTPLYPALLAAVATVDPGFRHNLDCLVATRGQGTCGRGAGPMRSLQLLMMAATFWMIWWSGWACTGRIRTGWLALGLALLTAPLLLLSVDYLMTESISLLLFTAANTLALKGFLVACRRNGSVTRMSAAPADAAWMAGAGVALGLGVLTRPGFAWLAYMAVAVGLAWVLAGGGGSPSIRQRSRMLAAFVAAALVVVLPWIVRNGLVLGRPALTFGYASHTLVQRLSFDSMTGREYGMSYVCWLPDGNALGRAIAGPHACDRFGWDDHPDSFYAIGIRGMLASTLRQAGGYAHHMSFLVHHYLLQDPLRQIGWHVMVTLSLALRGLYVDHYWGLLLAPICLGCTVRALPRAGRRRDGWPRPFLLLSLPAWFMLAFNAAVAVNQVRYNLMLIMPFSIAGALALEALYARVRQRPEADIGAAPLARP